MASIRAKRIAKRRARSRLRRAEKPRGRRREDRGDRRGRPEVRTAVASGIGGAAIRAAAAVLRSQIGKRALTIARQKISKVPVFGKLAGRTQRARDTGLISARTGREIAVRPTRSLAKKTAITGGKIAAGGLAFEAGSTLFAQFAPGGSEVARAIGGRRGTRQRTQARGVPFQPGGIVPTDSITHTWVANGVPFAQLADGRVMVRRKNGTIKTFRRPRPIVLGRNPGVRDIVRADKKIDALLKVVRKRFPAARRKPQHSVTHP